MAINWTCTCGRTLRVADNLAGRRVKCPACNSIATVPLAEQAFEVVEDTGTLAPPPPPKPMNVRVRAEVSEEDEDERPKNKRQSVVDEDEEEDEKPRKRTREDDDELPRNKKRPRDDDEDNEEDRPRKRRRTDDDEEDDRPRKKKLQLKKGKKIDNAGHFRMERGVLNAGVLGGLAAMVGAVVWFVVGYLLGFIFYYPPVLFVLGLIAMIKGVLNRHEESS